MLISVLVFFFYVPCHTHQVGSIQSMAEQEMSGRMKPESADSIYPVNTMTVSVSVHAEPFRYNQV